MGNRAKGALRLDVPFSSVAPRLTSDAVGLPRIVKSGSRSFVMDATVLDAPDGRLLRAGVTVAHRVVDGLGEWYLAAPGWAPHLPEELSEPVDAAGDLPESFGLLIRPLLRRAVLGTLATIHLERDEWSLRTADGESAAAVRDDRVTIKRSGISTARFREVEIVPTDALTGQQRDYLVSAGQAVGATVVERFPELRHRIGAPATGLTSFPKPRDVRPDSTLEEFASAVFSAHLHAIVRADLARRSGTRSVADVDARLWAFGRDLRGLASVLEPAWREELELALAGLPFDSDADVEGPVLQVIDGLVGAVRAPRLGDLSHEPAAQVLFARAEQATYILAERCRALAADSPNEAWQGALRAAEQLEVVLDVAAPLFSKHRAKLSRRLSRLIDDLRQGARGAFVGEPDFDGLSAQQAYQLGRDTERKRIEVAAVRQAFVDGWPEFYKDARKLVERARRRQER